MTTGITVITTRSATTGARGACVTGRVRSATRSSSPAAGPPRKDKTIYSWALYSPRRPRARAELRSGLRAGPNRQRYEARARAAGSRSTRSLRAGAAAGKELASQHPSQIMAARARPRRCEAARRPRCPGGELQRPVGLARRSRPSCSRADPAGRRHRRQRERPGGSSPSSHRAPAPQAGGRVMRGCTARSVRSDRQPQPMQLSRVPDIRCKLGDATRRSGPARPGRPGPTGPSSAPGRPGSVSRRGLDLPQRQAELAAGPDERDPPQHVPRVPALVARASARPRSAPGPRSSAAPRAPRRCARTAREIVAGTWRAGAVMARG